MNPGRGLLTEADVRTAQTAVDALVDLLGEAPLSERVGEARGVLMGILADVRTAGYLDGRESGRRDTAGIIRRALEDEGL